MNRDFAAINSDQKNLATIFQSQIFIVRVQFCRRRILRDTYIYPSVENLLCARSNKEEKVFLHTVQVIISESVLLVQLL